MFNINCMISVYLQKTQKNIKNIKNIFNQFFKKTYDAGHALNKNKSKFISKK